MQEADLVTSKFFAKMHPFLQSPQQTHGMCTIVSEQFISLRALLGDKSLRVVYFNGRRELFNNYSYLWGDNLGKISHTAILTSDDFVIDFTFRQFDTECSVPKISTLEQVSKEWGIVSIETWDDFKWLNPGICVLENKTHLNEHDLVYDWQDKLSSPVGLIPRFVHDGCDQCTFLGTYKDKDLYYCYQNGHPTVISRESSEPSDYVSGPYSGKKDIWIRQALWRAGELGLMQKQF